MTTARVKLLTSNVYSPTNAASEAAIRGQVDGSIQEVYDIMDAAKQASGVTVNLTGDQTVAGIKTFTSSPIIPAPTADMHPANRKFVTDTIVAVSVPNDSLTETQMAASYKKQAGGVAPYDEVIMKSLATATNDMLFASGVGAWVKKTLAEAKTLLGITMSDIATLLGDSFFKQSNYGAVKTSAVGFTVALTDANAIYTMTGTSTQTIVIDNSTPTIPIGTQITFIMQNTGAVVFSGAALVSKDSKKTIDGQYSSATLIKTAAGVWSLIGSLKA